MPPLILTVLLALTLAALAMAYAINSRCALRRALRDRAAEIDALNNRLLRLERRASARAFHHHGHRDEAVEITPPVVRTDRRNPFGYGR